MGREKGVQDAMLSPSLESKQFEKPNAVKSSPRPSPPGIAGVDDENVPVPPLFLAVPDEILLSDKSLFPFPHEGRDGERALYTDVCNLDDGHRKNRWQTKIPFFSEETKRLSP
jgi:hypothetical protein